MKIWLADLTYTQQSIASDVVPAGIGMIAEYTEKKISEIEQKYNFRTTIRYITKYKCEFINKNK